MFSEVKTYSILPKWLQWIDIFGLFEKDPFGNFIMVRRLLIIIIGWCTYYRYTAVNRIKIKGTEHLENLPDQHERCWHSEASDSPVQVWH